MDRHRRWTTFFRFILLRFIKRSFNFNCEEKNLPQGSNLILANHVTKADLFFISSLYKQHIYYVAGENVLRNPVFRWFAENCFGAIAHVRGKSSLNTLKQMGKLLKAGGNVCIFPEGSMTFDGRTKEMGRSIAKFAKGSSANLVLCTIEGGYLSQPRWGVSRRKGRMGIREFVIPANELEAMSVEQIDKVINEKLYIDAYESQEKRNIRYAGKNLCKGLECCIYECPKCKKINTLHTDKNNIFCECGYKATYDVYGYLTDNDNIRTTVSELCDLQRDSLKQRITEYQKSTYLFGDEFECRLIGLRKKPEYKGKLQLKAYSDKVEYSLNGETKVLDYDSIEGVFVVLRNTLNVIVEGANGEYELKGDFSTNSLKYKELYEIVKEINN